MLDEIDCITKEVVKRYKNSIQYDDEVAFKLSLNTPERIYFARVFVNGREVAMPISTLE